MDFGNPSYYLCMELYHVLNRGVEKRQIFMDTQDYARFIHDMFEFNDSKPAGNAYRKFKPGKMMDLGNPSLERDRIVDVHGWCLMKNHYHLLISELVEGGLVLFMRKMNVGYANYFNTRYTRDGGLFQGKTKKIRINTDAHFLHILNYIHLNPLDYLKGAKDWRKRTIESTTRAKEHLSKYRWSSYQDYCGTKNFPSILSTDLFGEPPSRFQKKTLAYLQDIEMTNIRPYVLE